MSSEEGSATPAENRTAEAQANHPFSVVGVGASAGGLEQDHRGRGAGITGDSPAKVRFAPDSLLEEAGFEPSVPL